MLAKPLSRLTVALIAVLALVAASCGSDSEASSADGGSITVSEAWTREAAPGQDNTAVYAVVSNSTDADVTITGASTPDAAEAGLHETTMDDAGVMAMVERPEGFVVPAGGEFVFEPGGPHVMLTGFDAVATHSVEVTFEFDQGDPLTFTAEVRAAEGDDAMAEMDHDDVDHDDDPSTEGDHDDMEMTEDEDAAADHDGHGEDAAAMGEDHEADGGDHHAEALDVSALHGVDEELKEGVLDVEPQRAIVAETIAAIEALNPTEGSPEAEVITVLENLDAALEAEDLDAAVPLAALAHDLAHDLGGGRG